MDVSRSPSKKQIRTSIISDFLVLARKLKTATLAGQPTSRRMKKAELLKSLVVVSFIQVRTDIRSLRF